MSTEIEVKAYAEDLKEVEDRLLKSKAKFIEEERQEDIYFSHPCRDFKDTDEALRLRMGKEGEIVLTYKGPKIDKSSKTREEIESRFPEDQRREIRSILEKLGFCEVGKVVKTRRKYILKRNGNRVKFYLDRVEGLGTFVEGEVEGEDIANGRDLILKIMDELELKRFERRSYLELLLERDSSDKKA